MPPKRGSNVSVIDFESLPNINLDLKSKEVREYINIQHEDIVNSESFCKICSTKHPNNQISTANDAVLGYCTMLINNSKYISRNTFLSNDQKNTIFKSLDEIKAITEKAKKDDISQADIFAQITTITAQLRKSFTKGDDGEFYRVIDYCRSQITKSVQSLNRLKQDYVTDSKKFDEVLEKFQRNKKTYAAQISALRVQCLPRNVNCIIRKLNKLEEMFVDMNRLLQKKAQATGEEAVKWFKQLYIFYIEYKAVLMGRQLVALCDEAISKVSGDKKKGGRRGKAKETEKEKDEEKEKENEKEGETKKKPAKEETKKKPTKEETKKKQVKEEETKKKQVKEEKEEETKKKQVKEVKTKDSDSSESESSSEEDDDSDDDEEEEEEEDSSEEDEEEESSDEEEESNSSQKVEEEQKTPQRTKSQESIYRLTLPILQLDCESESPILVAFWLSRLADLKAPKNDIVQQSFKSIYSEMRKFFGQIDVNYPAAVLFSDTRQLSEVISELDTKNKLGIYREEDAKIINLIHDFFNSVNKIKHPARLYQLNACVENGRKVLEHKIEDELINKGIEVSERIFNTIVPLAQLIGSAEELNAKAAELNAKVEPLQFDFPSLSSYKIEPYSPAQTQTQPTLINEDYMNYITRLCTKLEDEGISMFGSQKTIDRLIIPPINDLLQEAASLIKEVLPAESQLIDVSRELKEEMVDGRRLLSIIKEFRNLRIKIQNSGEGDAERISLIINILERLNQVHVIFYSLEIGGLIKYSNALHVTYLRVYSTIIIGSDLLEDQLLLAPLSSQTLADIQKNVQSKLQSDFLQQKISLLNEIKMSLGDIVSAAFVKDDSKEFSNYRKWIEIMSKLIKMTDIESVSQIKPLCNNLPELPGFPQIVEGINKLLSANNLSDLESKASNHIQRICKAVFNEDIAVTVSEFSSFRIIAMTRDYTKLIKKVVEYGFVRIDEDYELGQYGDSYINRFIEHHWHTTIVPLDNFFAELEKSLPAASEEASPLIGLLQCIRNGGMSMDSVIKFGNLALSCRQCFTNKDQFTLLYRKLYTYISFLKHHDTLAKMIGKMAESEVVSFSSLRTFNYIRFANYLTSLVMRINSSSVFQEATSRALFLEAVALHSQCLTLTPTMKLSEESIEKLMQIIATIDAVFAQNAVNYEMLFAKLKLCFKLLSTNSRSVEIVESISQSIDSLETAFQSAATADVISLTKHINDELFNIDTEDIDCYDYIDGIKIGLSTILSLSRLRCLVEPATTFVDNNLSAISFNDPSEIDDSCLSGSFVFLKSRNYPVPRPKITVPTTLLSLEEQSKIADIYISLKKERENLTGQMDETRYLLQKSEKLKKSINKARLRRQEKIKEFNALKDSIAPVTDESIPQEIDPFIGKQQAEYIERVAKEYSKRAALISIREKFVKHANDSTRKQIGANSKITEDKCMFIKEETIAPIFENTVSSANTASSTSNQELSQELDPQLSHVLSQLKLPRN